MSASVRMVVCGKTRPKRYMELCPKASSAKCRIFPCQVSERDFLNAVLPTSIETHLCDFTLKTEKDSGLTSFRTLSLLDTNGVLLYKKLTLTIIDSASPIWRFDACTHVRKLQVFQFKCLCLLQVQLGTL